MIRFSRLSGLLTAVSLAACTANGGSGSVPGGGPGVGDGAGGACLLTVSGLCAIGSPTPDLPNTTCTETAAGSPVTFSSSGPICEETGAIEGCFVYDPELAVDGDFDTFASMNQIAGVGDLFTGARLTLSVQTGPIPAGRVAGFLVEYPGDLIDAGVLRSLQVVSYLGGVEQEAEFYDTAVAIDVLGITPFVGVARKILVGFRNTKIYDSLDLKLDQDAVGASGFATLGVYEACTNATPAS
jgi:hypothetical protein